MTTTINALWFAQFNTWVTGASPDSSFEEHTVGAVAEGSLQHEQLQDLLAADKTTSRLRGNAFAIVCLVDNMVVVFQDHYETVVSGGSQSVTRRRMGIRMRRLLRLRSPTTPKERRTYGGA